MSIIGVVAIAGGTLVSVLAAYGLIDFPSPLSRMHASTKSASLGLALIVLGAGITAGSWELVGLAALVSAFLFLTAPISGHLLGRAAYLAGDAPGLVVDDLAGAAIPTPRATPTTRDFSVMRWAGLVVVWMLVWRDVSVGTALGGAVVAALVETLRGSIERPGAFRAAGLPSFAARYLALVVRSNLRVAWEVLTPSNEDIREAVVAVPLTVRSLSAALLVANAVSYTPGTLSLELSTDPMVLYVHVLHFESREATLAAVRAIEDIVAGVLPEPSPA
jgi:monovalent cation/proton antiporter MnhG/PhaG subunit